MREALLYERLAGGAVRCHVCQWRCRIQPGGLGACKARQNMDGVLYALNYGDVTAAHADPIEKKPLFHFYPGSRVFSLGTWGCNFHCRHCQNWEISFARSAREVGAQEMTAEETVRYTIERHCQGIAWTYNEPSIWFEFTLDGARLAKAKNLYTVYVTNGFMTPEALDMIGPYLDAYRVDVKGFRDTFYRELAKVPSVKGVLETARRAKEKWDMHVEVVTNIIPSMNDDDAQLEGIAHWIVQSLGPSTPWHVTRFYPAHLLQHIPATPLATLDRAYEIGKRAGLHFVYIGNVPGAEKENTLCPACGRLAIRRMGYQVQIVGMEEGRCRHCKADLNMRGRWSECAPSSSDA
ncbi:MAG: AmmeMemoRadiSam system radical SAM enzyme [Dehalococcoidia bacterium]|nr:AmmeMemoRadiSam system radical SAM enzyme [Dehalococcoidia bacterium]